MQSNTMCVCSASSLNHVKELYILTQRRHRVLQNKKTYFMREFCEHIQEMLINGSVTGNPI